MKSFVAVVAAFVLAMFVSACTSQPTAADGHTDHEHGAETSTVAGQPADFNDADVAFAKNMIPHHQQAVELSALVPDRSQNPQVTELAAAISAAQEPEIETMKVFLVQWTGTNQTGHEGHDMGDMGMDGMVDAATMDKLKTLSGPEFDTLWLQSMIGHHEGAIAMANTELTDGANGDAKTLAKQIVSAQQAEIDQMKQMVGG